MNIRTEISTFVTLYRTWRGRAPYMAGRWESFRTACWWMHRRWTDVPEKEA